MLRSLWLVAQLLWLLYNTLFQSPQSQDPRVKVSSLRSKFGISKLGTIKVTAYQPPAIVLNSRETIPSPPKATAVSLVLEVTSKARAELPRLLNVKNVE